MSDISYLLQVILICCCTMAYAHSHDATTDENSVRFRGLGKTYILPGGQKPPSSLAGRYEWHIVLFIVWSGVPLEGRLLVLTEKPIKNKYYLLGPKY